MSDSENEIGMHVVDGDERFKIEGETGQISFVDFEIVEDGGWSVLAVGFVPSRAVRVVGVDKSGQEIFPRFQSTYYLLDKPFDRIRCHFDFPPSEVRELKVEVCEFKEFLFENVPIPQTDGPNAPDTNQKAEIKPFTNITDYVSPPPGSSFNFSINPNSNMLYTYKGPKDASAPIKIWFKEGDREAEIEPDVYLWADEIHWDAGIQSGTATGNVIIDNTSEYRIESSYVEYDHQQKQAYFPKGASITQRLPDGPDNKIVAESALVTFDRKGIKSARVDRFLSVGETRLDWETRNDVPPSGPKPKDLLGQWVGGGGILPIIHTFSEDGGYRSEVAYATGSTLLNEGTWALKGDRLIRDGSEESAARIVDFDGDSFIVEYKDGERWGYHRTRYERVEDEVAQTGVVQGQVFIGDEPTECQISYGCY
ncbi:MAG: hypothetical protein KC994_26080, partial [Candidatus Omnitrophica bacterium]|nr:hypothetical protein [Candidatus Omnitrophota bacterium]